MWLHFARNAPRARVTRFETVTTVADDGAVLDWPVAEEDSNTGPVAKEGADVAWPVADEDAAAAGPAGEDDAAASPGLADGAAPGPAPASVDSNVTLMATWSVIVPHTPRSRWKATQRTEAALLACVSTRS